MKHSIETTGYTLLLFACLALALSGSMSPTKPLVPGSLGVPLVGQVGTCWCWAACVEMVTTYMHSKDVMIPIIPQCDEVNRANPSLDIICPMAPPIPSNLDVTGTPFSNPYDRALGYYWQQFTPSHQMKNMTIPYDTLCGEFAAGRPTIFQLEWFGTSANTLDDSGTHYLVAEGAPSSKYSPTQWVSINDPMPYIMGHHRIITYDEFACYDAIPAQPGLHPGDTNKAGVQWTQPMLRSFNPDFVFSAHIVDLYNITYIDTFAVGKGKKQ
jgi:hypothetical protein